MLYKNMMSVKKVFLKLSELGSRLNLSFSSHVLLIDKVIALDGIKKKLLVAKIADDLESSYTIELNEVKEISISKTYSNIKPGELNKKKFNEFLETILLQFEYKDQDKKIGLPFYESHKHGIQNLEKLERNARIWQMILSKMIYPQKDLNPINA
ncbi:MAG TPA: hypothetical protein VFZ33_01725 [Chitinophagaceae bacterium]